MPRSSPYVIALTHTERSVLEARTRRYTLPYRDVMRAKVVLLAAEGLENKEIGERLDMPRPCREQVAKALLPRTTRGTRGPVARRSPAGLFPLGWSLK